MFAVRCAMIVVLLAATASAQDAAPTPIDEAASQVTERKPIADDAPDPEKQRRAMAGLAAIAGIAIVGIGLLAITILWGARLRRLNRKPLPKAALKDEFWFLKPPKGSVESAPTPAPPSES
jgi:hypothetical protein